MSAEIQKLSAAIAACDPAAVDAAATAVAVTYCVAAEEAATAQVPVEVFRAYSRGAISRLTAVRLLDTFEQDQAALFIYRGRMIERGGGTAFVIAR